MQKQCTPHLVQRSHARVKSWRKAARDLNILFGVSLSHLAWRDYATGRRDIADPKTRAALMLAPRPCPTCGDKPDLHFSRLLKRMRSIDLLHWKRLRNEKRYREATRFIDEIYNRKK